MARKSGSLSKTLRLDHPRLADRGLAGFGTTSFTGRVDSIGRVGDTEIATQDYARALRNEIDAVQAETGGPLTFSQAQARGDRSRCSAGWC